MAPNYALASHQVKLRQAQLALMLLVNRVGASSSAPSENLNTSQSALRWRLALHPNAKSVKSITVGELNGI